MNAADQKIAEILGRYGEVVEGNIWRVQGQAVIYHKTLERIAAHAGIWFDRPHILRAQEREAVILVEGTMGRGDAARSEWSIGEANMELNYRVSPKMAGYPYAMAEKRAKDRVILKLIGLHGLLYSEEEADEFKRSREPPEPRRATPRTRGFREPLKELPPDIMDPSLDAEAEAIAIKNRVTKAKTVEQVMDIMLGEGTQEALRLMDEDERHETRMFAKARMQALGWTGMKEASRAD